MSNVFEIFREISRIPRCSTKCERISEWLCQWAKKRGFECKRDEALNVVIDIPPSEGYENKPVFAIQGHMDMVCVKEDDSDHDFDKDPIEIIEENGWIRANRTTLGADDGVALAIGLAIAEDKEAKHPPLRLLFTSDEEIGLKGAIALKKGFFYADKLINIDSETEGKFVIGCAGGEDAEVRLRVKTDKKRFKNAYRIAVYGLKGGHSGQEINKNRANAIRLIKDFLKEAVYYVQLCDIRGGKARNAIPDSAEVVVLADNTDVLRVSIDNMLKKTKEYYPEENVKVSIDKVAVDCEPLAGDDFKRVVDLLDRLPHGVFEMFDEKTPKTSNNLAIVKRMGDEIFIATNQRSLSEDGLNEITRLVELTAMEFGADFKTHSRYPSWTPDYNSQLLKDAVAVYKEMFNVEPEIEIIHAGLECGIIGSKVEGIDMVSIGPDMEDVHTPKERLRVDSFERIYEFVKEFLARQ